MQKEKRGDKYAPGVFLQLPVGCLIDSLIHQLSLVSLFIHCSLIREICPLCSQGLCGFKCAHVCVHACMGRGGWHLCVLAKEMKGHLQYMQMESELPVCIKPWGFMMENTDIKNHIKLILKNRLKNSKCLEPLEMPDSFGFCGVSVQLCSWDSRVQQR